MGFQEGRLGGLVYQFLHQTRAVNVRLRIRMRSTSSAESSAPWLEAQVVFQQKMLPFADLSTFQPPTSVDTGKDLCRLRTGFPSGFPYVLMSCLFYSRPLTFANIVEHLVHLDQLSVGDRVVHGRLQVLDHGHCRRVNLFAQKEEPG